MFSIADLLKGKSIPGLKASEERRICADTASALLSLKLSPKQFKYESSVVTLAVPPIVKAELMLRQGEYQSLLSAQGISVTALR
jgi:hypothetical protein